MIKDDKELNDVVCAAYKMGCDQTREVYKKRIEKLEAALAAIIKRAEFRNSEYVTDVVCSIAREALED